MRFSGFKVAEYSTCSFFCRFSEQRCFGIWWSHGNWYAPLRTTTGNVAIVLWEKLIGHRYPNTLSPNVLDLLPIGRLMGIKAFGPKPEYHYITASHCTKYRIVMVSFYSITSCIEVIWMVFVLGIPFRRKWQCQLQTSSIHIWFYCFRYRR